MSPPMIPPAILPAWDFFEPGLEDVEPVAPDGVDEDGLLALGREKSAVISAEL